RAGAQYIAGKAAALGAQAELVERVPFAEHAVARDAWPAEGRMAERQSEGPFTSAPEQVATEGKQVARDAAAAHAIFRGVYLEVESGSLETHEGTVGKTEFARVRAEDGAVGVDHRNIVGEHRRGHDRRRQQ